MEVITIDKEIKVIGLKVNTFPTGIGEAFNTLMNSLPDGTHRSYYGISNCKNGHMSYIAAAEIKNTSEAIPGTEQFVIDTGLYITKPLWDWRKHVNEIKEMFEEMMHDERVKPESTCIEWYKDDNLMFCMIKIDDTNL
jgi:predicted transcriptional regulator YdeE